MATTKKEVSALDEGPVTRVSQSAAAKEIIDAIRALRDKIPGYEAAPKTMPATIRVRASMPSEFLEAAAVAVASSEALGNASKMSPDELREAVAFGAAFEAVADEAEAFARAIRFRISSRRADAASAAMVTYDMARSFGKRGSSNELVSHVKEMQRSLGKRGIGKKKAATKPATA